MFKKKETKPAAVETMSRGEWMQKYWRPCAAFMYIACCLTDFAIFPIMFTVVQFWEMSEANDAFRQWIPITLQGGGLFHVSMCAVLGVSAYGRTQEKLNGASGGSTGLPSPAITGANNVTTPTTATFGTPAPAAGSNFGSPAPAGGFVNAASSSISASSFGSTPFNDTAAVVTGFGGKPAPVIPPFPEK